MFARAAGDDDVVNVVQGHPHDCALVTRYGFRLDSFACDVVGLQLCNAAPSERSFLLGLVFAHEMVVLSVHVCFVLFCAQWHRERRQVMAAHRGREPARASSLFQILNLRF